MKKIFSCFVCCSLFFSSFCEDEKKEEVPKLVSDEAALVESVGVGVVLGGLLYLMGKKLKWNGLVKGSAAASGLFGGFVLDSKFGIFPQKTKAAFFKLGLDVLQGKVSDPDLLKQVGQLTQECAVAFIKELMKQYGADGAQQALAKLKTEVRKGHGYLKAIDSESLKKPGRIFSAKIDLDDFEKNKEQMETVLQKIDQTKQLVRFRRRFLEVQQQIDDHKRNQGRLSGTAQKDPKNLRELCEKLKEDQKKLSFQCVDQQEFDQLFKCSDDVLKGLEKK